jgi:toxin ParE1/3/4
VKRATFHAEAEAEYRAALAVYERQQPGLGGKFRAQVEAAVERIRLNPQAYIPYDDQGARACIVRRFPYILFYVELADRIWIAALAHQRRRPKYWTHRKPE